MAKGTLKTTDSRGQTGGDPLRREIRAVVKGVLNHVQEQKIVDVQIAAADITTAGLVQPITQHITVGDLLNQRDGYSIILKELDLTWYGKDTTAAATPSLYRLIVFVDSMNTGVLPAVTDVITAASPTSGYNVTNFQNGRFKILVDAQVPLTSTSATASFLRRYRMRMNRKIEYLGSTFATASNGKTSIWALTISDRSLAANTRNELNFQMKFTDS